MIDTIVFDLGNVLVDFCWEKCFRELGYEGKEFEDLADATVRDDVWNQHDKGELSSDEILSLMIANNPAMESAIRDIYNHLAQMINPRDYAFDWIASLKKAGYKVYILSNFSKKCYEECTYQLDVIKNVDGVVFSFMEKLIKPDEKIYKILFERYNIKPENAVFVDDRADNIMTARSLGMTGIVFESKEQVEEDLNSLIGIRI